MILKGVSGRFIIIIIFFFWGGGHGKFSQN